MAVLFTPTFKQVKGPSMVFDLQHMSLGRQDLCLVDPDSGSPTPFALEVDLEDAARRILADTCKKGIKRHDLARGDSGLQISASILSRRGGQDHEYTHH